MKFLNLNEALSYAKNNPSFFKDRKNFLLGIALNQGVDVAILHITYTIEGSDAFYSGYLSRSDINSDFFNEEFYTADTAEHFIKELPDGYKDLNYQPYLLDDYAINLKIECALAQIFPNLPNLDKVQSNRFKTEALQRVKQLNSL